MKPDLSPTTVSFMVIGLLMERLGLTDIRFPAREIWWGMSGTSVSLSESPAGDVRVRLHPLGDCGVPGASAVCPWPDVDRGFGK